MRTALAVVLGLLGVAPLAAQEIDSKVIHNYSAVGVSYVFLDKINRPEVNAHGGFAQASYEIRNFVLGVSGGYAVGDTDLGVNQDTKFWSYSAAVGYVFRLQENRFNLIPNVSYTRSRLEVTRPGFPTIDREADTLQPGITLSFAASNRFSVLAGYGYRHDMDDEIVPDEHAFALGANVAVAQRIGLNFRASFGRVSGLTGLSAGVSYHF